MKKDITSYIQYCNESDKGHIRYMVFKTKAGKDLNASGLLLQLATKVSEKVLDTAIKDEGKLFEGLDKKDIYTGDPEEEDIDPSKLIFVTETDIYKRLKTNFETFKTLKGEDLIKPVYDSKVTDPALEHKHIHP